jgi:teichuronic acid biosynthesis glycosyltransferase TuaG
MIEPLVSIVMPAYNAQQHIAESIESVITQTYTNWELIIVDDNSTDDTASIIKALAQKDPRVKYLHQDRGRQGKARNKAIKNSTGDYIAFLDADDLWDKTKLEVQVATIKSRPDIALLFTQGFILQSNEDTTLLDVKIQEWSWQKDLDLFITQNQIPILSVLVKKQAIINACYFSEDPEIQNAEDYHLWIKLLKQTTFLSIPNRLFYYRVHEQQSTYQNSNLSMAVANAFINLASTQIIDKQNKTLRTRLKLFIFQAPKTGDYLNSLKNVFARKAKFLSTMIALNKLFKNNVLIKRLTFQWL